MIKSPTGCPSRRWRKEEAMSKKLILCDLDTADNNYNYKCDRISRDDFNELEDPCENCSHRCYKIIDMEKGGEK